MVEITPEYISIGGNRHPAASDWARDGSRQLAFGADDNVAIWDPLDPTYCGVKSLLTGHIDVVNAVKYFPSPNSDGSIILSGSVDKTIRVWCSDETSPVGYREVKILTGHEGSINCLAVLPDSNIFVSGAADATVKIWSLTRNNASTDIHVELKQTLSLSPRIFPLAVAVAPLSSGSEVLAVAGTKATIQIYVSKNDKFELVATLSGHEGWIRSVEITRENDSESSDLLLASASQDKYIRLWRLHQGQDLPVASTASDPSLGIIGKSLSNKAHRFSTLDGLNYSITFEALLLGHEDWIYSVSWYIKDNTLQLLSASADNSLAFWSPDPASGVWICTTRLGEISAQKGSTTATGSTGGFYAGLWSPSGTSVVSLGRTGSWRLWNHDASSDSWIPHVAISGHTKEIRSLAWAPEGSYLLTTSADQTTRLHAQWKRAQTISWHEFARPQIHGYDLNCIAPLTSTRFVSGADEKLLRVFDEPAALASLLARLCDIRPEQDGDLPDAANMPVLGLSNKAIQAVDDAHVVPATIPGGVEARDRDRDVPDPAAVTRKSTLEIPHPPLEDHLARHTLWPEREKLYGHGYEISAVASSGDGAVIATACRASSVDHAVIRLYETEGWREVRPPLAAHALTVTGLAFDEQGGWLLSVGRDRMWTLFKREGEGEKEGGYRLHTSNPKAHARMILDAAWAPMSLEGGRVFATAGRDRCVKVWELNGETVALNKTITADAPVTAVAFGDGGVGLELAYGLETGKVVVVLLDSSGRDVRASCEVDGKVAPRRQVAALAWRPGGSWGLSGKGERGLAVAAEDGGLRIWRIGGLEVDKGDGGLGMGLEGVEDTGTYLSSFI
ncbi:elongator protein 2 [Patellaria atrata CBS 101060]|uniref:Elongator complex protein 2 n=1 Tax=Patellaria atrata CBS 101060 TaxID=1346257 RepID=A0A9P4SAS6_9PEZI|nr:elongator protein 2 [Patellaria atrata CBS 101060]